MDEEKREVTEVLTVCAEQLSAVSRAYEEALGKLQAQYASLNQKVDRIVAAVESSEFEASAEQRLRERVEELERENVALQVQSQRASQVSANYGREPGAPAGRKTMSPLTNSVLGKGGMEGERLDGGALEKALQALSVEQRIAVKAELARAGMLT